MGAVVDAVTRDRVATPMAMVVAATTTRTRALVLVVAATQEAAASTTTWEVAASTTTTAAALPQIAVLVANCARSRAMRSWTAGTDTMKTSSPTLVTLLQPSVKKEEEEEMEGGPLTASQSKVAREEPI